MSTAEFCKLLLNAATGSNTASKRQAHAKIRLKPCGWRVEALLCNARMKCPKKKMLYKIAVKQ